MIGEVRFQLLIEGRERLSGATKAVNLEVTISSTSTPKKTPIESEG